MRLIGLMIAALAILPVSLSHAQGPEFSRETILAPPQPGAIALPFAADTENREVWHMDSGQIAVRNVTRPTLIAFRPVGKSATGAVIIAPGGGFLGLAIEKEGWDIARWFANHGVTAFVLKYRVLPTPPAQSVFVDQLTSMLAGHPVAGGFAPPDDTPPEAYADGLAALRYVRAHAADYGINAHKVGFMGFSAGGFLTRTLVERAGGDRPDFAGPIYPNMAAITVPADAPPMFIAVAADDFLLARVKGFPLAESYRAAGRPLEFHLFSSGGHGFGPGIAGTPTQGWLDLMLRWMKLQHMIEDDH